MLDDWQNDTCEGKYLKSLFERKIKKNQQWENNKDSFGLTKYYNIRYWNCGPQQ